jgi:hypothetical protein
MVEHVAHKATGLIYNRKILLGVYLSEVEHRMLMELAEEEQEPMSRIVRRLIRKANKALTERGRVE